MRMDTQMARTPLIVNDDELLGLEYLSAMRRHEVIVFADYGDKFRLGLVSAPGTPIMSVYPELSENGVPSNVHVTSHGMRSVFRFRPARPEEYAGVEFSYGYRPRAH